MKWNDKLVAKKARSRTLKGIYCSSKTRFYPLCITAARRQEPRAKLEAAGSKYLESPCTKIHQWWHGQTSLSHLPYLATNSSLLPEQNHHYNNSLDCLLLTFRVPTSFRTSALNDDKSLLILVPCVSFPNSSSTLPDRLQCMNLLVM